MKFRTLIATGTAAIALMAVAGLAYAAEPQVPVVSETAPEAVVTTTTLEAVPTPEIIAAEELAFLKKEQQTATNALTKMYLRFKIRGLENQLNIKKALK